MLAHTTHRAYAHVHYVDTHSYYLPNGLNPSSSVMNCRNLSLNIQRMTNNYVHKWIVTNLILESLCTSCPHWKMWDRNLKHLILVVGVRLVFDQRHFDTPCSLECVSAFEVTAAALEAWQQYKEAEFHEPYHTNVVVVDCVLKVVYL